MIRTNIKNCSSQSKKEDVTDKYTVCRVNHLYQDTLNHPVLLAPRVQMASELLKDLVASGKVTLHHCDVAALPLADATVDKVFHCNCYYFWPDLSKGTTEIHRVMKPGHSDEAHTHESHLF